MCGASVILTLAEALDLLDATFLESPEPQHPDRHFSMWFLSLLLQEETVSPKYPRLPGMGAAIWKSLRDSRLGSLTPTPVHLCPRFGLWIIWECWLNPQVLPVSGPAPGEALWHMALAMLVFS